MKINFASDNAVRPHPTILDALKSLESVAPPYGDDIITERFQKLVQKHFGPIAQGYLVFNGTAANVLGLASQLKSFQSVIASSCSHLNSDECGALEKFAGCKILTVQTADGKLRPRDLEHFRAWMGGAVHHSQPAAISITQSTEWGTVYTKAEIQALADFAHDNRMILHMDGARFSNACVSAGESLRSLSTDAGVDVLSFGGTKNGLLFGEAVLFLSERAQPNGGREFGFVRKQGMQLASKMQVMSRQFEVYLESDLWKTNAIHANEMATRLAKGLSGALDIVQNVEANAVFPRISKELARKLQERFFFYMWDEESSVARLMCTFDTKPEDVDAFVNTVKKG